MSPRPSYENEFIIRNGKLVGFAFGYDACAEHECGLRPLMQAFGLKKIQNKTSGVLDKLFPSKPEYGLATRVATQLPPVVLHGVRTVDGVDVSYLIVDAEKRSFRDGQVQYQVERVHRSYRKPTIEFSSAWADDAFVICGSGPAAAYIDQIHVAIQSHTIALGSTRPNLTSAGGLCLYLVENFPADEFAAWEAEERTATEELQAHKARWHKEASDVIPLLKSAGKEWFSLTAENANANFFVGDDGQLRVWLNPCQQNVNNSGWFTADDLRQWAVNEGPVVKRSTSH